MSCSPCEKNTKRPFVVSPWCWHSDGFNQKTDFFGFNLKNVKQCSSSQSQAAIPMPSCPCPPESPKAVSSLGDALPVSSSYKCIQNHCFTGIMAISYISRFWLYYHIYPNLWRWSPWFWPFISVPKSIPKPGPSRFGRRRSRLLELHTSSSYWVAARRRRSALNFSTCWKELVAIWAVFNSLADD